MTSISLLPLTADLAADIFNGRRHSNWAPDFPTEGDMVMSGLICRRIAAGVDYELSTSQQPWLSLYIVDVDGVTVGGCGFKGGPDPQGRIEIGYGIAESFRGRGIATAAVGELIALVSPLGLTVTAETEADNAASARVLEKCGFIRWQRPEEEHLWWQRPPA